MRKDYFHFLVVATFLIGISLPVCFLRWQAASVVEQRTLAPFPHFGWSYPELTRFPIDFERFFNDHFGGRFFLIHGYSWLLFSILGVSPTEKVVAGKNGWLFYELSRNDLAPNRLFTVAELERWKDHLAAKHRWLQQQGLAYVFIIAPDKHTIYGEYLPTRLSTKLSSPSRYDQLVDYVKAHSDVPIIDLRPALLEAKKDSHVYRKIDSHWNTVGAAVAQYEIARSLGRLSSFFQPKSYRLDEFLMVDHVGGDLSDMMNVVLRERIPILPENRFAPCESRIEDRGIPLREWIVTVCPGETEIDALIFRDSFFTALQPYVSRYFHETTSIWSRPSLAELQKMVMERKPDLVLEERVERDLPEIPFD